eukprot:COSAG06_NODE_24796_length_652_cov_1.028933_1_plen_172_part_10
MRGLIVDDAAGVVRLLYWGDVVRHGQHAVPCKTTGFAALEMRIHGFASLDSTSDGEWDSVGEMLTKPLQLLGNVSSTTAYVSSTNSVGTMAPQLQGQEGQRQGQERQESVLLLSSSLSLWLNVRTANGGSVTAELQDAGTGKALEGFELENSVPFSGNALSTKMIWACNATA